MITQFIRQMYRRFIAHQLRKRGNRLMRHYMGASAEIALSFHVAEVICPSLKPLRRHSKACAKVARKLLTSKP